VTSKLRFAALAMALAILTQCGGPSTPQFPDAPVILISVDTLRADRLPAYGYRGSQTPAFDAFAADAALYERAYTTYPLTLPAHATLFTGNTPPRHGVRDNAGYRLDERFETLPEALKAAGYDTGGVVSGMVIRRATGLAQGFDVYDDRMDMAAGKVLRYAQRRGDQSVSRAKQWLEDRDEAPFFLFLHLYDPHAPYEAPEPFATRGQDAYDGEIAYVDDLLGGFFDFLKERGIYDKALIVLLSDHGEMLGDHGEQEHGILFYRGVAQVPMLVKLPGGLDAGRRIPEPVGLIDIKPSILAALGLRGGDSEGMPIFGAAKLPDDRLFYGETLFPLHHYGWSPTKSAIQGSRQYLEIVEPELYDLAADPDQSNNVYDATRPPREMAAFLREFGDGLATKADNTREEMELLASLGYTGEISGNPDNPADPKAQLPLLNRLNDAKALIGDARYGEAEALLVPLLEANPAMYETRYALLQALVEQGKFPEAEYVCLEGLSRDSDNINYLTALVNIKLKLGKRAEALKAAEKAFAEDADTAAAALLIQLADVGAHEAAARFARDTLARFGDASVGGPYANMTLGRLAQERGDFEAAAKAFGAAIRHEEKIRTLTLRSRAHQALGDSLARLGQNERALGHFRRAAALNPASIEAQIPLAALLASMQRGREAIEGLDRWLAAHPAKAHFERAADFVERLGATSLAAQYRQAAAELD